MPNMGAGNTLKASKAHVDFKTSDIAKFRFPKYFLVNLVGVIIFKLLLENVYKTFIVPVFSYNGYNLNFNTTKYLEGWIIYIILYFIIIRLKKHVLFPVLFVVHLILVPPIIILYGLANENSFAFHSMTIAYSTLLFLVTNKKIRFKQISFKYGNYFVVFFSLVACVVVLLNFVKVVGIGNINFDLSKVYVFRSEYGELYNKGFFGYLNSWVTKVINVFLIGLALYKRNYMVMSILFVLQVMFFGFSGHKQILFIPALLFFMYFLLMKVKHDKLITVIVYGFISLITLIKVYYMYTGDIILPSIFIRRVFFVPAFLNYVYFDFASSHQYILWSDNKILKYFISYPYELPMTHVIGAYLGHPEMGANTGFLGSGYFQGGLLGVALYVLIISMLLNMVNSYGKNFPKFILNTIFMMPVLTVFISSDLFTSLLTHGFLVSLMLVLFYNSKRFNYGKL